MAVLGMEKLVLPLSSLCGLFTVFGTMLLFRIMDEFKDAATDKILFPNRPLPRGAVRFNDIRILGIIVFILMLVVNVIFISLWIPFAIIVLFGFLTFKWFFMEKYIRNNLILAVVTHQPLTLIVNIYAVCTVFHVTGHTVFTPPVIGTILIFFLPVLAWETSRKIKPRGEETEYVTYSKLFGPVKASLFPLFCLLTSIILLCVISLGLNFSVIFYSGLLLIALVVVFFYLRFMINPVKKNQKLKSITEYASLALFILILSELIINKGVHIAW
jgi:4-hydroxybenzoate polyprenyltransferase